MKVKNSIRQVDRAAWEQLRDCDNMLTDPDYMQAVEKAQIFECEHRYFEFYECEQIICSMSGVILLNDAGYLCKGISTKIISFLRRFFPKFLMIRTLEIGSPINSGMTISTRDDINAAQLSIIVDLLKKYSRDERISIIVFRDFNRDEVLIESVLQQMGLISLFNMPTGRMDIVWDSFEQYMADLKKRYRSDARRKMNNKSKHDIRTSFSNDANALDLTKTYTSLFENVRARSEEYQREIIGEQYHIEMYNHLKEQNCWLRYFKDDELVAFSHFIVYKGVMKGQFVGMDYETSHKAMLYFNFIYDSIRHAIENDIRTIEAGPTTYEAKSSSGFSILPQRMYIWHRIKLVRLAVPYVYSMLTDFQINRYHYAFDGNKYQYLWDGKAKTYNVERQSD